MTHDIRRRQRVDIDSLDIRQDLQRMAQAGRLVARQVHLPGSPVITMRLSRPSRVSTIFIWATLVFCASST